MIQAKPRRLQALVTTLCMTFVLGACGGGDDDGASAPPSKGSNVPSPTVTLLPSDAAGSPNRNYTFFSVDFDLASYGYVQEEFIVNGKANAYDTAAPVGGIGEGTPTPATANLVTPDNPYTTRVVVIRPSDPTKFAGTVLVEWQNVTNNYDIPVHWMQQRDMILRKGYAWVGVSAQSAGIANAATGLKAWSPTRYGALDVTNGGKISGDLLSYDIFSQAAKAVRTGAVMGGLPVKRLIAVGASQSAGRLGIYFNAVHPLTPDLFDAALLTIGSGRMRTDLSLPIIKVLTQTELTNSNPSEVPALQPDTPLFHTWEIAGATHSDAYGIDARAAIVARDLNLQIGDNCGFPTRSRVPTRYVYNGAIERLQKFLDAGTPVPTAPPIQGITAGPPPTIALDARGISVGGGIRLGEVEAPIALDNGTNTGANLCQLNGTHIPFDKATLDTLYPTHDAYVSKYSSAVANAVAAGFILAEDGQEAVAQAQSSIIGYGLNCATLCADVGQFPKSPSIGTMRLHVFVYNLPDRSALLDRLDDAAFWIATGYLNADPSGARPSFRLAVASIQAYATLLDGDASRLSPSTLAYLKGQANTLIAALNKL